MIRIQDMMEQEVIPTPSFEGEKKKKKKGLSKKTINIIRTTLRNNIDLTAIADNKANVLLSLNALMIAALFPVVLSNMELIKAYYLGIPLLILAATCFTTIYFSAQVLKPSDFDRMRESYADNGKPSPFFFGNFYKDSASEYFAMIKDSLKDADDIKSHLAQDLYYIGRRLGEKMSMVRTAYNIFITGIFVSLFLTIIILMLA